MQITGYYVQCSTWEVVDLIKGHEVAKKRSNQKQAPPAQQLLVLLKFLGTSGNGANQIAILDHFWDIGGHGTIRLYIGHAIKALWSLLLEVVRVMA